MIETEGKNLWDLAETVFWNSRRKPTRLFKQYLSSICQMSKIYVL